MGVWIWGAVMALSLLIEFISVNVISIWFTFGGLVGLILAICGVQLWIQIVVAIILSFVLLFAFRPLAMKFLKKDGTIKTNVDSLVGQQAVLLENVTKNGFGTINISGVIWTVCSDSNIKAGKVVTIVEILGNKLKVAVLSKEDKNNLPVETIHKIDEKKETIEVVSDTNLEVQKIITKDLKKQNKKIRR